MTLFTKARHIFPRNVKIKFIFLLVGIIVGAQIETLTLSVIQPFIMIITDPSIVYNNRILFFLYHSLGFRGYEPFLASLAVMIALVYTFRGFYVYFFARIQNRFLATNTAIMSTKLLTQTLKQPYLYHVNNNAVGLQRVVSKNAERLYGMVNNIMLLLIDGFMALFMLVFLMITSFSMTLIVLFFASVCIFVYFKYFRSRIQTSGDDEAKGIVQINKSVLQALYGIKEIKISRREAYFTDKFKSANINTIKTRENVLSLRQLPKLFIESLCFSGAFIVVAGVILIGVDMETLIPQLGMFMLAAFKLLPAISRLVNNIAQIMRHKSSIAQVYRGLFEHDEAFAPSQIDELDTNIISRDIIVSDITFKYPKTRKPILRDISLAIPNNKSVGFVGMSGSGKTTLVDIILGILAPQQGSVFYNGKSVHHHFAAWVKNVGYIPQVIYLLDESILENIAFGIDKKNIDEDKVWRALEQAQLKEFVQSLPDGLQTQVGDRGVRLSGGQRQRIGIARALYENPSILVLDEATAALDNETEKAVMEALQGLKGSKTMIIIAHRLSTIEHCDIVYKVKKGRVVQVR